MSVYLKLEPYVGENVEDVLKQMVDVARRVGCNVHALISSIDCTVTPDDKFEDIRDAYWWALSNHVSMISVTLYDSNWARKD